MAGPGGAQLSLSFGATDGGVGDTETITAASAFDPRVPRVARFGGNGRLYLFLGATAHPGAGQTAGAAVPHGRIWILRPPKGSDSFHTVTVATSPS